MKKTLKSNKNEDFKSEKCQDSYQIMKYRKRIVFDNRLFKVSINFAPNYTFQ